MTDNDHLSCVRGERAQLGDGPALYMRPDDPDGTIRFWPSGEIAELDNIGDLWTGQPIKGTPYEAYVRRDDPAGTLRIRLVSSTAEPASPPDGR